MFMEKVMPYILMVVFFAIIPVTRLIQSEYRRMKDKRCDEIKVGAQVADKRIETGNVGPVYYASFRLAAGELIELEMGQRSYGSLEKGMQGTLTYQGKSFLGFKAS